MIHGVGTDIVEYERFNSLYARYGMRALARVCSTREVDEMTSSPGDVARLMAERFAAKEAVMKALGRFFDAGVYLRDIDILSAPGSRMEARLPASIITGLGGRKVLVSLSSQGRFAIAAAMITDED
jgi:holo-[acyl-carrier-protein] synthase